jgi:hypothetical protein
MGTLLKIIEEMFEKMILLKHPSTKRISILNGIDFMITGYIIRFNKSVMGIFNPVNCLPKNIWSMILNK